MLQTVIPPTKSMRAGGILGHWGRKLQLVEHKVLTYMNIIVRHAAYIEHGGGGPEINLV